MICHTIYALIHKGVVKNVTVGEYEVSNFIAKASYGDDAFAKEVTQYPVKEGDLYENGNFYSEIDGVKHLINPIPTVEEELSLIGREMSMMAQPFAMLAQTFDEKTALASKYFYNEWESFPDGETLEQGMYLLCDDVLYKVIQQHQKQSNWKPGVGTETLFQRVDLEHIGTIDDPIPAATNMIYYKSKVYIENDVLYVCTRDSGIPLQHLPSQLVGHYFEVIK